MLLMKESVLNLKTNNTTLVYLLSIYWQILTPLRLTRYCFVVDRFGI